MTLKYAVYNVARGARLHSLAKELRRECDEEPKIEVTNRLLPLRDLAEMGLEPDQVFFNAISPRAFRLMDGVTGGVHMKMLSEAQAIAEYLKQIKIAMVIPDAAPVPIALGVNSYGVTVGWFMMHAQGIPLRDVFPDAKSRETPIYERVVRSIEAAVYEMHARGVGHGDLAPKNILVTTQGKISIVDPLPIQFRLRTSVYKKTSGFVISDEDLIEMDRSALISLRRMSTQDLPMF